jgi:hypothetical protein
LVLVLIAVAVAVGSKHPKTNAAILSVHRTPDSAASVANPGESYLPTSMTQYPRLFGVASDPWHVDDWDRAVGASFDIVMNFYAWSKRRDPTHSFEEAARRGVIPMITWEPWRPVAAVKGPFRQGSLQPVYANAAIASGHQDAYIRMFARAVADHPGPVIIRYGHEMNGYWYPWHRDPEAYVRAWRHVVSVFHAEGAANAVFVWSVNPSLYISDDAQWMDEVTPYWPGGRYVDLVGSTMINFGGIKEHGVTEYVRRIRQLRTFGRPVMLTEVNVDYAVRKSFLRDLSRFLARADWVQGVVWSQFPSRGQATLRKTMHLGNMNWQATHDPASAHMLGEMIQTVHRVNAAGRRASR